MKNGFSILGVVALSLTLLFSHAPIAQAGGSLSAGQVSQYKEAKAAGKLVEVGNGYLSPGAGADGGLVALMNQINALRKEKYQAIANTNNVPLQAVEMSAGSKLTD
ncbi:MAG: DUF1318 domain-containing protein [Magnetococcales bacterium]|nr:DUF1318 domain-containing protein [Magnetococcales bacterium]